MTSIQPCHLVCVMTSNQPRHLVCVTTSPGVCHDQQPASSLSVWAESTSLEEMDNQTDGEFVYEI